MASTISPLYGTIATRIMLNLTGRRWTWPQKRVTEEYWVPETVWNINLVGRPVSAVNSVIARDGTVFAFELSDSFRLRLPTLEYHTYPFPLYPNIDWNGGIWPPYFYRGVYLTVDYIYGSPPPADVQQAIDQLAQELQNFDNGQPCNLPERVTTVSREGINWTVLDPQQFLVGGKTGLYYPDLVISTYGNKVRARAKVYSPEHRPPRRLTSQVLPLNYAYDYGIDPSP